VVQTKPTGVDPRIGHSRHRSAAHPLRPQVRQIPNRPSPPRSRPTSPGSGFQAGPAYKIMETKWAVMTGATRHNRLCTIPSHHSGRTARCLMAMGDDQTALRRCCTRIPSGPWSGRRGSLPPSTPAAPHARPNRLSHRTGYRTPSLLPHHGNLPGSTPTWSA
jgi:hypothetical protein